MGNQKRQLFVPGPPKFTKGASFPSAFRATRFRSPASRPMINYYEECGIVMYMLNIVL